MKIIHTQYLQHHFPPKTDYISPSRLYRCDTKKPHLFCISCILLILPLIFYTASRQRSSLRLIYFYISLSSVFNLSSTRSTSATLASSHSFFSSRHSQIYHYLLLATMQVHSYRVIHLLGSAIYWLPCCQWQTSTLLVGSYDIKMLHYRYHDKHNISTFTIACKIQTKTRAILIFTLFFYFFIRIAAKLRDKIKMQDKNNTKTEVQLQKTKSSFPDHESSPYVVNNSLPCALMPKRTSINVNAFLQMHRKLLRKKVIEKTFHSSLNQLASQAQESPKGFKGSAKTSYRFYKSSRDGRAPTQSSDRTISTSFLIDSHHTTISHLTSQIKMRQSPHTFMRPNMNINLNLFKKNHKRPILKNDHLGYKLIQNFSQTNPATMDRSAQRVKKSYTVS